MRGKTDNTTSACVSNKEDTCIESKREILKGRYKLVFMSLEFPFHNLVCRGMLSTDICLHNLVAFVVDKAHRVLQLNL